MGSETRKAKITYPVRFTPEAYADVKQSAEEAGISISDYVRRRCLGLPIRSKQDKQIISELRKIGGLQKLGLLRIRDGVDDPNSDAYESILKGIERVIERMERDI